jgi:hypothetical protein
MGCELPPAEIYDKVRFGGEDAASASSKGPRAHTGHGPALWEMIHWYIRNLLEGRPLAADDPKMIALQSYITHERRGVELDPGNH